MSDLPELLEAVTRRLTKFVNAGIEESGGEPFGVGDLRPIAAELIDYTLNREFGDDIDASAGGWTTPPKPDLAARPGEAGASNLPNECCESCGIPYADCLSVIDGLCGACALDEATREFRA